MEEEYKGKLTESIEKEYEMNPNIEYEIKEIQPQELINSKRIDIIVKLKYIENVEKHLNCKYYNELYKKHIEAFSEGTFVEYGSEDKDDINKYIKTFDELIESIKKDGFDENKSLVPVGSDNIILDGAHRTSIAIYYNKPIKIIVLEGKSVEFGIEFFKERLLNIQYIEYILTEYCKLKKDVFVFCVWPRTEQKEEIEKQIRENVNVLYTKDLDLTYNGYRNFMIQIYGKYDWVVNVQDKFKVLYIQIDGCYKKNRKAKIYVVEGMNSEQIKELKAQVRDKPNGGKLIAHSSDCKEETIEMAELLLNKNTLDFLNIANPDKFEGLYKAIQIYKEQIKKFNLNKDEFVIDADSVLAVYGLKEQKKLTFLTYNKEYKNIENEYISCNNKNSHLYNENIQEIINNPKFYFYFWNVKFVSLELVRRYKKNNGDKEYMKQIDQILSNKKDFKYRYNILKTEIKRFRRNYKVELKKRIKLILIKMHIKK